MKYRDAYTKVIGLICICISLVVLTSCSSQNLSRDKAANILKTKIGNNTITKTITLGESTDGKTLYVNYLNSNQYDNLHQGGNKELGDIFGREYGGLIAEGVLSYKVLAKRVPNNGGGPGNFLATSYFGLFDNVGEPNQWPGQSSCPHSFACSYYDSFAIDFTPTAQPYVSLQKSIKNAVLKGGVDIQKTEATMNLATIDKVTVTGLSAPSDAMGRKIIIADYVVEYKPTPIGTLYIPKESKILKKPGSAGFILYDDGWRLEG